MIRAATSSPAGSTDLRETAAEWLVRRQDASWSAEDERELAAWLDADPAHRQASIARLALGRIFRRCHDRCWRPTPRPLACQVPNSSRASNPGPSLRGAAFGRR
ncbi:FecR/PupR family sigma factor regulator [Achromobacter marplatensis]|uniref:FecR/PupR family sigma factor regulator n=1 Tax=Achromobacter marplatensis TaxID=470868 RepID=UPI003C752F7F